MYIFGNAPQLAKKSEMWRGIVSDLEKEGSVGDALPLMCARHPETLGYAKTAQELRDLSPDGELRRSIILEWQRLTYRWLSISLVSWQHSMRE